MSEHRDFLLPPELARLVRVFPRDDRPVGLVNAINSRANLSAAARPEAR